jgi:YD repeat-containing protein
MLTRWAGPVVLLAVLLATSLNAQNSVRYIYDELGRLVGVIDASGNSATYHFDAVGNLLSISRGSPTTVTIVEFTPNGGSVGESVTIYGTGFSATAGQNTVSFNGTSAAVASATTTTLVTTVPGGATTGPLSITTPNGQANSGESFVVGGAASPAITSFTPSVGAPGTAVAITGTNFEPVLAHNLLSVNQSRSNLTGATTTVLDTVIPPGTASGRFLIVTPKGTAVSTEDFFIPPAPYTASDVASTARLIFASPANLAVGTAGRIALAVFDGLASQRVSLKVVPGPISAIGLYRPNQTQLAGHSTGILTTLMEPPLLPSTGTYQFTIDPTGAGTGTTALTLYAVPPDVSGAIVAGGAAVPVTTTVPGQNARLTFTGEAGTRVSLLFTTGPDGTVSIVKPDGTNLVSKVIGIFSTFVEPVELPASGPYSVFTNYAHAGVGTVTHTLYAVADDITGTISPGGSAVPVAITTPGQNGSLTFAGTASQRVSLTVSAAPFGTVSLRKPDGTAQASISTNPSLVRFMEPQTLATTDTYAIKVNPDANGAGTYTLTLYDVPADVEDTVTVGGAAVPVSIGTPGQNARVTFSGASSQPVTVRLTGNTMGYVTVRLLKPDGTQLTKSETTASNFNLATQTLPVTGTYTVVIDPLAAGTGSINLQVTNP